MSIETILSLLAVAAFVIDLAVKVVKTVAQGWAQRPSVVL